MTKFNLIFWLKRRKRENDKLFSIFWRGKNTWSLVSTTTFVFMAFSGVSHVIPGSC